MTLFIILSRTVTGASAQETPTPIPSPTPSPWVFVISPHPWLSDGDMKNIALHHAKYETDPTPGFPVLDNADDPRTVDRNDIEGNFLGQGDHSKNGASWTQVPYADLNYGTGFWIFKHLQLKAEGGYTWDKNNEMGNLLFGIKWMFYDGTEDPETKPKILKNLTMGIYPQVQISLQNDGKLYIFPFLVTKKFNMEHRPMGVGFNAAYEYGTGDEPSAVYWSLGTGVAVAPRATFMASYSEQYNFGTSSPQTIRKYEFGLTRDLKNDSKIFFMIGHQDDGTSHVIWNAGVQKVFHTKNQKPETPTP